MSSVHETSEERAHRLALERQCATIGRAVGDQLRPGTGFALFFFDFGPNGAMAYVSSADRGDVVRALKEFIAREENRS